MSATQSLRRLVPLDRIKELILTGRKFTGEQAYEYGLATELAEEPLAVALEMASTIAKRNPQAARSAKKMLNNFALLSVRDGLLEEGNISRDLIGSPNQMEAIRSVFEKREPSFSDLD